MQLDTLAQPRQSVYVPTYMRVEPAQRHASNRTPPHTCSCACDADSQFIAMLNFYRAGGGLARAEEVIEMFRHRHGPDVATLARWIVKRDVVSFDWQAQTWLPLFQFARQDMRPLPELAPVLGELNPVFDGWETAVWFTQPNTWLDNREPALEIGEDYAGVLQAARAARFIAHG